MFLGLLFSTGILEGADPASPAHSTDAFLGLIALSWGLIGGIAFSPWLRFPPSRPTTADLVWTGGLRGAAAGVAAMLACVVLWWLLGLGGPNHREIVDMQDAWQWAGTLGGGGLVGFFLGAVFSVIAGRDASGAAMPGC